MAHMTHHNGLVEVVSLFRQASMRLIHQIGGREGWSPEKVEETIDHFLGNPLKLKAMKDPNLPSRPKSAYHYYCAKMRVQILKKKKGMKLPEVSKALGQGWRKISEKDKKEFIEQSDKDKERYKSELETYNQNKAY